MICLFCPWTKRINYSGFPREIPAWFFFVVRSQIAVKSSSRMRNVLTNEHTGWWNGGRREAFAVRGAKSAQTMCIRRSKRIQNMPTSFVVDPHWKISSVFGTGRSVNHIRYLFMSEHLSGNLSSRNMLYQPSYLMLIERSIDANLIVYVDVNVNQAEYQYEV